MPSPIKRVEKQIKDAVFLFMTTSLCSDGERHRLEVD
jgi:hypothetical protein